MADIVTTTTIADNPREAVFAFQYQYVDTGNESAVTKIDVSSFVKEFKWRYMHRRQNT